MKNILYLLLSFLLWGLAGHPVTQAQVTASPAKIVTGSYLKTSLSFTGLGISAGISLKRNNLALMAGPRFALTNSYRLAAGPWGAAAALYYYTSFSAGRRLQGLANIDYQNSFQRPYCPAGDCGNQRLITHEISLGYGLQYALASRLSVMNAINVGFYRESLPSRFRNDPIQVQGLNMLVKLGFIYHFRDEN